MGDESYATTEVLIGQNSPGIALAVLEPISPNAGRKIRDNLRRYGRLMMHRV